MGKKEIRLPYTNFFDNYDPEKRLIDRIKKHSGVDEIILRDIPNKLTKDIEMTHRKNLYNTLIGGDSNIFEPISQTPGKGGVYVRDRKTGKIKKVISRNITRKIG